MTKSKNKKILIISGEESGEMHGASLVVELKRKDKNIEVFGVGGDKMIAAGVNTSFHIKDMAFLGIAEIIKHLPFIRKVEKELLQLVEDEGIKTAVLIDYPGFNLRIAKKLRKKGVHIIYYISPQIWAWGKGRIKKIKKLINKMIVVFPFEKELYDNAGIPVEYVGHPLIERIDSYNFMNRDDFFNEYNLESNKEILLLMPGSRKHEIEKLLPELLKAADRLAKEFDYQIVLACSENLDESYLSEFVSNKEIKIVKGKTYELLKYSKFGIIKSDTSTLEAAIFSLPFVVVYSTSRLTYFLGKSLVKIKNIAMPNIIAGKDVVKEFIQDEVNSTNIFNYCKSLINNSDEIEKLEQNLNDVKIKLGESGASEKAAEIILAEMNED